MSRPAILLYNFPRSGHAHRAELMLSLLQLPTEMVFVDLAKGEHKTPEFLALNSFGQVPVIDDGGTIVSDSILVYLAKRYGNADWLPEEPAAAARVQRWLSAAAGPLAFGACAARLVTVFGYTFNTEEVINRAHGLFTVMEGELSETPFLTGDKPSIADIANYSYVAHAPEGNVSLEAYPNIRAWLARIEALPGFVPMPRTAAGLQA
jgi:glutathione S-transferase